MDMEEDRALRAHLTKSESREVYGLFTELGAHFTVMDTGDKKYLAVNVELHTRQRGDTLVRCITPGWVKDIDDAMCRLKEALLQVASLPDTLVIVAARTSREEVFVYDKIKRQFSSCTRGIARDVKLDRPDKDRLSEFEIADKGLLSPAKKFSRMKIIR